MITAPVECLDLLQIRRMNADHKPNHFTPGHLGINTFLDDAARLDLPKNTGNIAVFRPGR